MSGAAALSTAELNRYARQIILPQFGGAGQARLKSAHVVVIGAGGLGCPMLTYLAAAGVGMLTIIDDDMVDISNLQRQPLFSDDDIGMPKAEAAARALARINPHVDIRVRVERLTPANAAALIGGADLVLDGCDNFATRLAVNSAAVALKIPLLSAAIGAFDGQIALFTGWRGDSPCYACLVGADPAREALNCAEAGVMGALPGMVGAAAALEAVRHLADVGAPLTGQLMLVDMLARRWRTIRIAADPDCPICRD